TVPARIKLIGQERLTKWLAQIHAEQADRMVHGYASLADIIRWTEPPGRELFETLMVFENQPAGTADMPPGDFTVQMLPVEQHTHYPLAVAVMPGETYEFAFSYDAARFAVDDIARLADDFIDVIDRLVTADRDAPVHRLLCADTRDLRQIAAWNATD